MTGLTDSAGTLTHTYTYDAFGNEKEPNQWDNNPFRYCGEYFDKETGSIYLRARYYNPGIGRFNTEDPIRSGLNWYVYCYSSPVMLRDPTGKRACVSSSTSSSGSTMYFYSAMMYCERRAQYLFALNPVGIVADPLINYVDFRTVIDRNYISGLGLDIPTNFPMNKGFDDLNRSSSWAGAFVEGLKEVVKYSNPEDAAVLSKQLGYLGGVFTIFTIGSTEREMDTNRYFDAIDQIIFREFAEQMISYSEKELVHKYLVAFQSLYDLHNNGSLNIDIKEFIFTPYGLPSYSLRDEDRKEILAKLMGVARSYNDKEDIIIWIYD